MTNDDPALLEPGPDGTQIIYRGRRLYPRRPRSDTEARVRGIKAPSESICLVPSPLLGYGVSVLQKELPDSSVLLFVESDPALLALSASHTDLHVHSVTEERTEVLRHSDRWFRRFRRVTTISLSGGYALNSKTYRDLEQLLRRRLQRAWQNKITTINMGRLWVANTITNLPLVETSRDIRDLWTHKSVAVVGAGPTLDGAISDLRRHRSSLFILSVDTALRALEAGHVSPDLVCVLEAQHANLDDVSGTSLEDQPVCADISSYPGLLRRCSPRHLYLYSSTFGEDSLLTRLGDQGIRPTEILPLGSVGAAAVAIAKRITDAPILLFGLDFAFAHGKTHARGTPHHLRDLRSMNRLTGSDPAPFTLSARTIPVAESGVTTALPLTTSELVTYNRVAEDLCRGSKVYDYTAAPFTLGRRDLSLAAVIERHGTAPPIHGAKTGGPSESVGKTGRFIRSEIQRLDELRELLIKGRWQEAKDRLTVLGYLTIDFPDADSIERSAATRLLAACSFYRRRWNRALAALRRSSDCSVEGTTG